MAQTAITPDEVAHLAHLARIEVSDEECAELAPELGVILDAISRVAEVVDADTPPMTHALPLVNVMREDVVHQSLSVDQALSGAPATEDGRFKVPQILSEDA